jgi:hypothetical protein
LFATVTFWRDPTEAAFPAFSLTVMVMNPSADFPD